MSDAGDMNLGWETIKGFSANVIQAGFGFVGTIVFARILGPTSFGGYYFLLSLIFLVNRPIWGIGTAAKKRFSEENSSGSEIVGAITVINVALVILATTVIFGTNILEGQTNVPSESLMFVIVLGAIIFFFPFQMLVGASGMPARATWIDTFRSVLTLPAQLGFVLAGFDAAGMGYGLATATALTIPITYFSVSIRPSIPSIKTFRSLWDFAKYSIPGAFVGKAYDRFDIILLSTILGTGLAGQYEVANKLTIPALFFSGAITSGLMPKISSLHSKAKNPTTDISNALSYASIIAIPIFFGSLALAQRIIVTVYGSEYAIAAPYLIGLALYKVVSSQTSIYRSTLSGLDKPDANLRFSTLALIVNVILGVALVVVIGGIGIVIATIVAETIQYLGTMYLVKKELPAITVLPKTLLKQLGSGLVMYFVVFPVSRVLVLNALPIVVFVVGVGVFVYSAMILAISPSLRVTARGIYQDAISEEV